jgi:hypothetical protein
MYGMDRFKGEGKGEIEEGERKRDEGRGGLKSEEGRAWKDEDDGRLEGAWGQALVLKEEGGRKKRRFMEGGEARWANLYGRRNGSNGRVGGT